MLMQRGPPRPRGQLGGRDDDEVEALVAQHLVRDVVALVHHDLARGDAQRVRAVVPLLALGRDAVAAATGDELDGMTDVGLQDALQRAVHFLDLDSLARSGDLEDGQRAHDAGMDGELVRVDLREHGVEVHEGAGVRDVERQGWSRWGSSDR